MQAPPAQPAMSFPLDNRALMRYTIGFILLSVSAGFVFTFMLLRHLATGRPLIFESFFLVLDLVFFSFVIRQALRHYGSRLYLSGGVLFYVDRNDKRGNGGPVIEIAELKALQNISQDRPTHYVVQWDKKNRIVFDRHVENYQTLIAILEQRTGKRFVLQRS